MISNVLGVPVGAEKRSQKRAGKFAVSAAQRGGSFETACESGEILAWLRASSSEVVEEAGNSMSVRPVFKSGKVGTEVIAVETLPGSQMKTRALITVTMETKPGNLNLNAIGPITKLMESVSLADVNWKAM
jgi:hypothetical protein